MRSLGCAGTAILALLPAALHAQDDMLLEHHPGFDKQVQVLFQSVARVADAGGTMLEIADLGAFKGTSLAGRNGETVWHLTYDSLLIRTRDVAGPWSEYRVPDASSAWAQVHLDERMRVTAIEHRIPTVGLTDPVGVLTGAPGMLLPAVALSTGVAWSSEIRGSLTGGLSGERGMPEIPTLSITSDLVLDSIVVRSTDTLAYLTLEGQVVPTSIVRIAGDDPGRFGLSGMVSGSLVWSSGWSLFVSGATRVQIEIRRVSEGESEGGSQTTTVVKTTRYQVQP